MLPSVLKCGLIVLHVFLKGVTLLAPDVDIVEIHKSDKPGE